MPKTVPLNRFTKAKKDTLFTKGVDGPETENLAILPDPEANAGCFGCGFVEIRSEGWEDGRWRVSLGKRGEREREGG